MPHFCRVERHAMISQPGPQARHRPTPFLSIGQRVLHHAARYRGIVRCAPPDARDSTQVGVADKLVGSSPVQAEIVEAGEQLPGRFFSNLNPTTLRHEPGTVWGSALLIAGTTVGAGILALPAITAPAGFIASSAAILGAGLYSAATGLLIAEVNLMTMCELGAGGVSLVSMAERTLGKAGTNVASAAYLFLHYALLVAYISKASEIASDVTGAPYIACAALFSTSLGAFCFVCSAKLMDQINGALVLLVIASFLGLLWVAGSGADASALMVANWTAVLPTIPVVMLAFVYQNVVPVVVSNLEGDPQKIRSAVAWGVAIPFLMFISWEAAILGNTALMSASSPGGASGTTVDPLEILQQSSPVVAPLIQGFSFLAVATSFIGFILGLTDYLSGLLQLPSDQRTLPYTLTLVPPFLLALTFPDIFFQALDIAGTYGVLTLFGLLPVAMAWSERYGESTSFMASRKVLVPGGKPVLITLGGLAAVVILREMSESVQQLL